MKMTTPPLGLPGFELSDYIAESIAFLRLNEPAEGYFVGFSGGKDSIVTLELVRQSGVRYSAGYSCTGIDYPEIPRFIRHYYPEVIFSFPKESYWSLLRKNGPPMRTVRWCCRLLKEQSSSHKTAFLALGPRNQSPGPQEAVFPHIREKPHTSLFSTGLNGLYGLLLIRINCRIRPRMMGD